jgi:hypothetical protein
VPAGSSSSFWPGAFNNACTSVASNAGGVFMAT